MKRKFFIGLLAVSTLVSPYMGVNTGIQPILAIDGTRNIVAASDFLSEKTDSAAMLTSVEKVALSVGGINTSLYSRMAEIKNRIVITVHDADLPVSAQIEEEAEAKRVVIQTLAKIEKLINFQVMRAEKSAERDRLTAEAEAKRIANEEDAKKPANTTTASSQTVSFPPSTSASPVTTTPSKETPSVSAPVAAPAPAEAPVAQNAAYSYLSQVEKEILAETNRYRTENGLPALVWDARLNTSARDHSKTMFVTNTFTHTTKYDVAENIYMLSTTDTAKFTAKYIVAKWMASPGHRANILNPKITRMGAGVVTGDQYFSKYDRSLPSIYATQHFN